MLRLIKNNPFLSIMFIKIFSHLLTLIIFKVIHLVITKGKIKAIFIENWLKKTNYKV
ncbi:hypothetical protein MED222_00772 [Vibrio sp. MED222]|nr:hypothetical protein MED222_00772 [Vibrio sp. MED222]